MIYIVEVKDKTGCVARKEYQACSLKEALWIAEHELALFPKLYVNEVWLKSSPLRGLYGSLPRE